MIRAGGGTGKTGEETAEVLSSIYSALGLALKAADHPHQSFIRLLRRRLLRVLRG